MNDIKFINNYQFGNKDEYECIFMIKENPAYAIHIWSRLINDIMNNEPDDVNKKRGLSKDWWERTGPYSSSGFVEINLYEYLDDLKKYLFAPSFAFEEADEALNLIISFLQFAASCHFHVIARLK